jgi:hypothetical protein
VNVVATEAKRRDFSSFPPSLPARPSRSRPASAPSASSASTSAAYGAFAYSRTLVMTVRKPSRDAAATNSASSRVLPTPASPRTTTSAERRDASRRARPLRCASSLRRPTSSRQNTPEEITVNAFRQARARRMVWRAWARTAEPYGD